MEIVMKSTIGPHLYIGDQLTYKCDDSGGYWVGQVDKERALIISDDDMINEKRNFGPANFSRRYGTIDSFREVGYWKQKYPTFFQNRNEKE